MLDGNLERSWINGDQNVTLFHLEMGVGIDGYGAPRDLCGEFRDIGFNVGIFGADIACAVQPVRDRNGNGDERHGDE